jgi:hypothetical protein
MKIFLVFLSLVLISCNSNEYLKKLDKSKEVLRIRDSKDNLFLGGITDYKKTESDKVAEIYVYENYIIFTRVINHSVNGFEVYPNHRNILYENYSSNDLIVKRESTYWFLGLYNNFLLVDIGTGPGIRGLEIIDLKNSKTVYEGLWNGENIKFIDDDTIIVCKYFNEREPMDDRGWTYKYKLHLYSFNFKTLTEKDINEIEELVSN